MSQIIKITCFYCGDVSQFQEVWIAKMYTKCKTCKDSRLKAEQVNLNSYYDGQTVTKDETPLEPAHKRQDPIEKKVEETAAAQETDRETVYPDDYIDYLDFFHE